MGVLSIRLSDQQKSEIEQAAKAAGMTLPEFARDALNTNTVSKLEKEKTDLSRAVAILSTDVEKLVRDTEKTAQRLSESLKHADLASARISKRLNNDQILVIGICSTIAFGLALCGAIVGIWLMR
jgi:hypothetical protein